MANSLENSGMNVDQGGATTMGHYSEHMLNFAAQGGVLLGTARSGNTTHSLLGSLSGMTGGQMPKPKMGDVTLPPRKY